LKTFFQNRLHFTSNTNDTTLVLIITIVVVASIAVSLVIVVVIIIRRYTRNIHQNKFVAELEHIKRSEKKAKFSKFFLKNIP